MTRTWHLVPSSPGQLEVSPNHVWSADPCCGVFETEEAFVNYLLRAERRYGCSWYRGTRKDGKTLQVRDILIDEKGKVVENGYRVEEKWLTRNSAGLLIGEGFKIFNSEDDYILYLRSKATIRSFLYKGVEQDESSQGMFILCNPSVPPQSEMKTARTFYLSPATPDQLKMFPEHKWSTSCGVFETEEGFVNYLFQHGIKQGDCWYLGTRDCDNPIPRDILFKESGIVVENGNRVQEMWLAPYHLGSGYVDQWNTLYQTEQEYIAYLRMRVATSPVSSVLYKGVRQGEKTLDTSRSIFILCDPSANRVTPVGVTLSDSKPTPPEYLMNYRIQADPKRKVVSAFAMPVGSLGWLQENGRDAEPVLKISVPAINTSAHYLVYLGSNKQVLLNCNMPNEHTARNTYVRLLEHAEQLILVGHIPAGG